ncbi:MAG: VCBS repeat-containing protein [Oscillospiraceae bacterium]|jgi:hypothetical protein|nr:VCBS repeat-containing protein [Oscillospiraceae bacterium]
MKNSESGFTGKERRRGMIPFLRAAKCEKKQTVKPVLLAVSLLAVFLAAHFLIRVEQTYQHAGDEYRIVRAAGQPFLLFSGGRVLKIRRIGSKNVTMRSLQYAENTYVILVLENGFTVYDHDKSIFNYENENQRQTVSSFVADCDNDGNDDIFLLLGKKGEQYGEELLVFNYHDGRPKKMYDASFQKVNPWKVQVCDVDGDGQKEVSLGVYTVAKFHPVYAKRPFLYYFKNGKLYPKWLGSRLSRPFDDYIFCNVDQGAEDELISVETTRVGKKELNVYRWTGFGFESIGVSKPYDGVSQLKSAGKRISAVCNQMYLHISKTWVYQDGKLKEEE